jgi:DNA-binding beta-propeller fold protein YncE
LNTSITGRPRALLGLFLALASCGFGESGIEPPSDRIFFPAGIAVDPAGQWLYVVNSNSDLRFNAGTVVAVDLNKVKADRQKMLVPADPNKPAFGRCTNSVFVQPQNATPVFCCVDFVDSHVLNCDERQYVDPQATVRMGSFGGTIKVQKLDDARRRLFVAVRAEPSLTYVDATVASDHVTMGCPAASAGANAFCTDDFRIKTMKAPDGTDVQFPEEPHAMTLDDSLGVLYVAHLGGFQAGVRIPRAVSVVDVCHPANDPTRKPVLASILDNAFPSSAALGVRALTLETPGDPSGVLLGTSENTSEIAELVFEHPDKVKTPDCANRDLTLVAGRRFSSSVFGTRGADLRGLELTDGGRRAYVLHRQFAGGGEYNPPAVVEINREPDAQGLPLNEPLGVVSVCSGPNRLLSTDAGRGLRLLVNCFENGQVYVVNPELLNVEAIIEVGAGPAELVISPKDPTVAFVANFANNNVSVLDLKPDSPTEYRVVQRIGFARASAIPK